MARRLKNGIKNMDGYSSHMYVSFIKKNKIVFCRPAFRPDKQEVLVEEHPVITEARRGDLIRVLRYVEGSHNLEVRDFQMTLFHKKPLPTDEPLDADSEDP